MEQDSKVGSGLVSLIDLRILEGLTLLKENKVSATLCVPKVVSKQKIQMK